MPRLHRCFLVGFWIGLTQVIGLAAQAGVSIEFYNSCKVLFLSPERVQSYELTTLSYEPWVYSPYDGHKLDTRVGDFVIEYWDPRRTDPYTHDIHFVEDATATNLSLNRREAGVDTWHREMFHEAGLKAVYASYGPAVDSKIVQAVIATELSVPLNRQKTFMASHNLLKHFNKAFAFFRIFDGSTNFRSSVAPKSNFEMPLEIILKKMGKSTDAVQKRRDEGNTVKELGKYFILPDLTTATKQSIRSDIMYWLIRDAEQSGPQTTIYFAHVATAIHERAYRQEFGFRDTPSHLSQGLQPGEKILEVTGTELIARLKEKLAELDREYFPNTPRRSTY